jgi:hypothetical protein
MSVFGTSQQAILKQTPVFGKTWYQCDVEKMIDGIFKTYEAMVTETARYPCALHLHPTDFTHLRMDPRLTTTVTGDGEIAYFLSMRLFQTPTQSKGAAQLTICPGCLWPLGTCANKDWKS